MTSSSPANIYNGSIYTHTSKQLSQIQQQGNNPPRWFKSDIAEVEGSYADIKEDLIIIGNPGFEEYHAEVGTAVLLSFRSGSGWNEEASLLPLDRRPRDRFGSAVCVIRRDLVVVGAEHHLYGTGAAHIFARIPNGTWVETSKLTFPGSVKFGNACATKSTSVKDYVALGAVGAVLGFY
jgi:FG-GAP repeat